MRRNALAAAACAFLALVAIAPAAGQPAADTSSPALRISFDEFTRLYRAGDVLVLDVRDRQSYESGHIPAAISTPHDELERHLRTLKTEKRPIVTYCS